MGHRNLVICDTEPEYARNLMEVISQRKEITFQIRIFSDAKKVQAFSAEHSIDILLMSDEYPLSCRREVQAKKRFLLSRGTGETVGEDEKSIFKYQAADQILTEIMEAFLEDTGGVFYGGIKKNDRKLIGVYSPVHRIGKTAFAIGLGKEMAKKEEVLYLNLEEYALGSRHFPETREQTLTDLLYYANQEHNNLGIRLSTMVVQMGELDYVCPMPVSSDIRSVTGKEWKNLLEQILEKSIYETVILDIGDGVQDIYDLLRLCDTIYTPYIEEPVAKGKLAQYVDNLWKLGYEEVLERTVQKEMPPDGGRVW